MSLNTNIGRQSNPNRNKENKYLTEEHARHVHKKIELVNTISISTIMQETEQDRELNRLDDTSRDINPYRGLIVNNIERVDMILSQMEQWSILSNVVNYI